MKKSIILGLVTCFLACLLQAQLPVSGTVLNYSNDTALQGVRVTEVQNPDNTAVTNAGGSYGIVVSENSTLQFSLDGMHALTEEVNGRSKINVKLRRQRRPLPQVPGQAQPGNGEQEVGAPMAGNNRQSLGEMPEVAPVWRRVNGGNRVTFHDLMKNNLVYRQTEMSDLFAACATLAGTYDQVLLNQQEIKDKFGYWNQFAGCYSSKDVSIFDRFEFAHFEQRLEIGSAGNFLLRLLSNYGPAVIFPNRKFHESYDCKSAVVVLSEVSCDQQGNCNVRIINYQNAGFYSEFGKTPLNQDKVVVAKDARIPRAYKSKYVPLAQDLGGNDYADGGEVSMTLQEFFNLFGNGDMRRLDVYIALDQKIFEKAALFRSRGVN